ncbi:hypothetical protein DSO57_1002839 [Entomophthora muscae]|uniref:Uncharacterized protein n=2 Tax=Entomophthora muscae TaxID=34485 RepID=A0ACC2RZS5_9FUNG|nr:hypothetical protein DSO57_1002839 [Entomophthora muscae]
MGPVHPLRSLLESKGIKHQGFQPPHVGCISFPSLFLLGGHLYHSACILKWMNSGRSRIQCPICKEIISRHGLITIYQEWPALGASNVPNQATQDAEKVSNERKYIQLLEAQKSAVIEECKAFEAENQMLLVQNKELITQIHHLSSVHHQNVEFLQNSRIEKERQSQKLLRTEQELVNHKRELAKLKLKINYLDGLDIISKIGERSEEQETTSFKNYIAIDPEQQKDFFCSLERKCREQVNQRKMYFKMFQEEKKRVMLLQEKLNEIQSANLLLEKKIEESPYPIKAKARPCPSSTPEPKVSRVKSSNPFLRRVNSSLPSQASSTSVRMMGKRSRSPSSATREDLGDGLQALSLDPEIILVDDDSDVSPAPRKFHLQPPGKSKRDVHGFFT